MISGQMHGTIQSTTSSIASLCWVLFKWDEVQISRSDVVFV